MEYMEEKIVDFFQDYEDPYYTDEMFLKRYGVVDVSIKGITEAFREFLQVNNIEIIKK